MSFYSKSVIPLIESGYSTFTRSEREIADFFLSAPDISDFSAKVVAETVFVSKSSLSRFAKKCGFSGYREFIFHYKNSFPKEKKARTAKTVFETYQELLNKTYNLMDEAQLARITRLFYEKNRVIIFGLGSNGYAAREMESRFSRIGVDIDALDQADRIKMQAPFLNPGHLVIGFSLSGETESVLYLLKKAKKKEAATILFTSNNKESYHAFCDEVVLVASLNRLNSGNTISPQFPMLLMMDLIYNEYTEQNKNEKADLHSQSLQALIGKSENDFFHL